MQSNFKKEISEEKELADRRDRRMFKETAKVDENLCRIQLFIKANANLTKEELILKVIKLKLVTKDKLTNQQLYQSTKDLVEEMLLEDVMNNLPELDSLLTTAINTYLSNYGDSDKDDIAFIYLIQSNVDKWTLGILAMELSDSPLSYKYKSVVKVTIHDLIHLQTSEESRNELLKTLKPSNNLTRYTDLDKEANKELN